MAACGKQHNVAPGISCRRITEGRNDRLPEGLGNVLNVAFWAGAASAESRFQGATADGAIRLPRAAFGPSGRSLPLMGKA
jgi:hypothetical protein